MCTQNGAEREARGGEIVKELEREARARPRGTAPPVLAQEIVHRGGIVTINVSFAVSAPCPYRVPAARAC